jgi:hypothetical protein
MRSVLHLWKPQGIFPFRFSSATNYGSYRGACCRSITIAIALRCRSKVAQKAFS